MIREHTSLNLLIGLVLSVLIHAYVVMWGPPFSMPMPNLPVLTDVELQVREWPTPSPIAAPTEALKSEVPPPVAPTPEPPAKPTIAPNTQALQEALQTALTQVRPDRVGVQLPERLPALSKLDSQSDPMDLAQALKDTFQHELPLVDSAMLPDLPTPERRLSATKDLPPLPALERHVRPEAPPARATTGTWSAPQASALIKGPAAERQVIFQPPPPSVTVETESEIELRFWILPSGAVGRVVPVKKSEPRLEVLAINYLRNWRFTPLPSDAPQDEQWGIIPFKFRIR
jgi:Gram-negative bacterial TonB protein C-terminal